MLTSTAIAQDQAGLQKVDELPGGQGAPPLCAPAGCCRLSGSTKTSFASRDVDVLHEVGLADLLKRAE